VAVQVLLGGPNLVEPRLLAAVRGLLATYQSEVENLTLEVLGSWDRPLNKQNEVSGPPLTEADPWVINAGTGDAATWSDIYDSLKAMHANAHPSQWARLYQHASSVLDTNMLHHDAWLTQSPSAHAPHCLPVGVHLLLLGSSTKQCHV
jgi:hypothetical protein